MNIAFNLIEHGLFCFAIRTIGSMNFGMTKMDNDVFQRPCLAVRVQRESHRGACAQRAEQKVVGIRTRICTARGDWLIGHDPVWRNLDLLRERLAVSSDVDCSYFAILHYFIPSTTVPHLCHNARGSGGSLSLI